MRSAEEKKIDTAKKNDQIIEEKPSSLVSEQPVLPNCSLEDILSKKIQKLTDIEKILEMLKGHSIDSCDAYTAFNPLIRLRGTLLKMHVLKLTKYPRLIYLNPIEGVFDFLNLLS